MKDTPSSESSRNFDPSFGQDMDSEAHLRDVLQRIEDQQSELKQLRTELKATIKAEALNTARQLEAFYQLCSLVGDVPDSLHGWPISPDFALKLVRQIQGQDYDLIVEFGSGVSTYLELRSLETWTRTPSIDQLPKVVVFEHLDVYRQQTSNLIANCPLKHRADLSLRPLESWKDESGEYIFYSGTEIISKLLRAHHSRRLLHRRNLDSALKLLVVIDGPPGTTCPWARYPAVPIILNSCDGLSVAIDFLLDDVIRLDEQEMANAWENMLQMHGIPYTREDLNFEKGGLLIHVPSLKEPTINPTHNSLPAQQELTHDLGAEEDLESIIRKFNRLELECDRRYAALRLSQEQALRIEGLEHELREAQHTMTELRSELDTQIKVIGELKQSLAKAELQLEVETPETVAVKPIDPMSDREVDMAKLRDENLLLQLQLQQVQEELEHYVLLSKGISPDAGNSMNQGGEMLPVSTPDWKTNKDAINANRAFLQTSA